jgi:hypothetical protein
MLCLAVGGRSSYIPHNTHTNPTTNATIAPRTSHRTPRERLRQPAVMELSRSESRFARSCMVSVVPLSWNF